MCDHDGCLVARKPVRTMTPTQFRSASRKQASQAADAKRVGDLIAGFPFAMFHVRQWVLCAVTYAACATTDALMPWLVQSLRTQLPLDASHEGLLTSIMYCGMMVGSVISGVIADALGRRTAVCTGLAIVATLQFGLSFLSSFWPISSCLFVRGMAYILVEIVAKAQLAECLPAAHRGLLLNLVHSAWQLGAAGGTAITYRTSDFQALSLISSFGPAFAFILALLVSEESPMWLLHARGRAAAESSLRVIARACQATPLPTPLFNDLTRSHRQDRTSESIIELAAAPHAEDAESLEAEITRKRGSRAHPLSSWACRHTEQPGLPSSSSSAAGARESGSHNQGSARGVEEREQQLPSSSFLLSKRCWPFIMRRSTMSLLLAVSAVWIVYTFASISTGFLLIRFLQHTGRANLQQPLRFTEFGSKLLGGILGAGAVDHLGRKRVLAPCFLIMALGTLGLSIAVSTVQLYVSVIVLNSANEVLGATLMTFSVEIFPTEQRTAALGLCIALARLGASVSIGIGPALMDGNRGPALPFQINALVLLFGAGVSVGLLPAETSGMALM